VNLMDSKARQFLRFLSGVAAIVAAPCAFSASPAPSVDRPSLAFSASVLPHLESADDPLNPYNQGAQPTPMPEDARIVVFVYNQNQVYKVLTAPMKVTVVELAPDEFLTSDPAQGDTQRWNVDTDGKNHVYIKPYQPNLVNSVSFTTNKHDYDFTVISSPAGGFFYQRARFQYPESLLAKTEAVQAKLGTAEKRSEDVGQVGVSPDKLNWNYQAKGTAGFKPTAIFDDGKFVWMRLPADAAWPVVFAKENGDEVVVNTIRRGDWLVVERLASDIYLRKDKEFVEVLPSSRSLFSSW